MWNIISTSLSCRLFWKAQVRRSMVSLGIAALVCVTALCKGSIWLPLAVQHGLESVTSYQVATVAHVLYFMTVNFCGLDFYLSGSDPFLFLSSDLDFSLYFIHLFIVCILRSQCSLQLQQPEVLHTRLSLTLFLLLYFSWCVWEGRGRELKTTLPFSCSFVKWLKWPRLGQGKTGNQ